VETSPDNGHLMSDFSLSLRIEGVKTGLKGMIENCSIFVALSSSFHCRGIQTHSTLLD